jgi:hypothetical protein
MLKVLLIARLRHHLNFVRYHFDRRTLFILAAIAALIGYQVYRSPADIGYSLAALGRPGFGSRWTLVVVALLPVLFLALLLLARVSVLKTRELDLLRSLPVSDATQTLWLLVRHLSTTVPLLILIALPALGDTAIRIGGVIRAAGLLLAGLSLDGLALWMAGRERATRRGVARGRFRVGVPIRGGTVRALLVRDLSHLLRRALQVPLLVTLVMLVEGSIVLAGRDPAEGLMMAFVIQALHAVLQMATLDVLFRRDETAAGLLKALPLRGAHLWTARALLCAAILAIPGFLPLFFSIARGASAVAWGAFLVGAIIVLPLSGGLLYADVHVALFPRTHIATFLLMTAVAAIVLFWFFVPLATPILVIILLSYWGLRAPGAFDRMEPE